MRKHAHLIRGLYWEIVYDHNLVSLKRVSPGAPNFFLIHDGSGEVNSYVKLCQYLDSAVNCWGIDVDKGDDIYAPGNLSIGEIAGQYIEKIREYFPDIKFYLDSHNITGLNDIWSLAVNFLEANHIDIENLKKLIPGDMLQLIPNLDKLGIKELVDYVNVMRTLVSSQDSYRAPGKIHIPIHYFGATRSREVKKEQWKNYSKKSLKIHEINGDHFSIFRRPAVAELAKAINNEIKNCI